MYNGKIATNDDDFILIFIFSSIIISYGYNSKFFSNIYIYRKKIIMKITINIYSYYERIIWP